MAYFIPAGTTARFGNAATKELRPQLMELEPTAKRLARLHDLATRARFLIETEWHRSPPHPDVSLELLDVAAEQREEIDWLAPKITVDDYYGCWALPLATECDDKRRARYPTLTNSRFDAHGELAHRFVVRRLFGPLDTSEHLDHLCRVHACCNPLHLEAVSQTVNTRRGNSARSVTPGQIKLIN